MKRKYHGDPQLLLLAGTGIFLVAALAAAVFFSCREIPERFSMDFYFPVFKLVHETENLGAGMRLLTANRKDLADAVWKLRRENTRLAAENASLRRFRAENKQLRALAGFKLKAPRRFKIVFAEVLLRDPARWRESFVIDKGADSGIREGDLAVAVAVSPGPDGLFKLGAAGRIQLVSKHTASVATILSRECPLGVRLDESNAYGILAGPPRNGADPQVSFLPADTSCIAGEAVLTSGFSENIPPDIPVGTVAAAPGGEALVTETSGGLSRNAGVKPLVNPGQLRFVAVLATGEARE